MISTAKEEIERMYQVAGCNIAFNAVCRGFCVRSNNNSGINRGGFPNVEDLNWGYNNFGSLVFYKEG